MAKTKKVVGKKGRLERTIAILKNSIITVQKRMKSFLGRRPHRSFRITRRRDYKRSFNIEGYFAFSSYVRKTLWANKGIFIWVVIFYAILSAVLVGMSSQDAYSTLTDTIDQAKDGLFVGDMSEIGRASLLFIATISGSINTSLTEVQQFWASFIFLLTHSGCSIGMLNRIQLPLPGADETDKWPPRIFTRFSIFLIPDWLQPFSISTSKPEPLSFIITAISAP